MHPALLAVALLLAAPAAFAQQARQQAAPQATRMGEFQSWTAATTQENGQKVCYAFARARAIEGVPNREARNVMLVVTHRPGSRDQVAVRAGYTFARNAEARLFIGQTELPFYTNADMAFARNGREVVAALRGGRDALLRAPGPNGRGQSGDTFPLAGFSQAYDAISRECPPAAPRR
ncbi:MAG: invasion associated locus B family protein [Acetobacteraceae bacterium]|nr:invasion associated locus B family protein [Acetobacteraceae bacterium]